MTDATTLEPKDIIANCTLVSPQDNQHNHSLIQRFGSPNQSIYIDYGNPEVDGVKFFNPLIMPIVNGELELIQCAVMQDEHKIMMFPDGLSKGFSYYGEMHKDQPIIITFDLASYFKIAQTSYSVVLVLLPTLCTQSLRVPTSSDVNQIEMVVNQLANAGFQELYMPVRSEYKASLKILEQNINIQFIEQFTDRLLIDLSKFDEVEQVQIFLDDAIAHYSKECVFAKGHLAKPFLMKNGSCIHILEDGLFHMYEKQGRNGEKQQVSTLICSNPLIVLGEARSTNSDNWQRVVQIIDKDGKHHIICIPYKDLVGNTPEAFNKIAYYGLIPPYSKNERDAFVNYLINYPIAKRFRSVAQTGWHDQLFVTPNRIFGKDANEELLFPYEGNNPYRTFGSFKGWQELSKLIEPHALGVLAFSYAFAGQLVALLGIESGGFHIYGSSTDGKSTITKAACSVWGNPKEISKSWRTTDNALENEAELRNDNFLNLDELRQAVPKAVSDIIYMLTGGQGKARSTKAGKNRDLKQFNLVYCSTGEVTLEEHLRRGNIELDAGLLLRFAHLPSDVGSGHGVFEEINYGSTAQDVGNRINELSSQHYGLAGIKWLEYLTDDKDGAIQKARCLFDQFIQKFSSIKLNGQSGRVLRRFALAATAGELATLAGITGWQVGRAFEAIAQCFKVWLGHFGLSSNLEDVKILEHFKAFFEAHGNSRFEDLTVNRHPNGNVIRPRIQNRVGYYDPDEKVFLVDPILFKKEMCIGLNVANAKRVLGQNNWIKTFKEGEKKMYGKKVSLNSQDGGRDRMMHFNIEVIKLYEAA